MKRLCAAFTLMATLAVASASESDEYWLITESRRAQFIGKFTRSEVESLDAQIRKVSLPFEYGSKGAFSPPPAIRPKLVRAWDAGRADARGRVGGLVEDYWLNSESVLRVVQVYYMRGDHGISRVEKLAVIPAKAAYAALPRDPF